MLAVVRTITVESVMRYIELSPPFCFSFSWCAHIRNKSGLPRFHGITKVYYVTL